MSWESVIGLEVHVQLATVSKIFSGASTRFGAAPNTQACPVDLALPGVLPVLNRGAVERAIQFGLAIGATIAPTSVFARKNYFYPDLPKGYQISQFEIPVVQGGSLSFVVEKDGKATVEMTNGQAKQSVNFVAVDGLWMPADADAEKWAEAMKKWEDALSTTQDGALLAGGAAQMVPLLLDPILEPAVKAQSAREFHAAMDGWLAMAAPLIAQASRFGIGGNRSRGGDPYGYGSGYDDMDMQDYYEEDVGMDDTQ